jgi:hypothetical protein
MRTLSTSPQARDFAERLIAIEITSGTLSERGMPTPFHVCEKLRRPLTALAGAAGYHSILSRALTLATREAPGLSAVQIKADGSLEENTRCTGHNVEEGALLVTGLIGLLFSFVGETLTLRLIDDVWPGALFMSPGSNRSASTVPLQGRVKHGTQGSDAKSPSGVLGADSITRRLQ